MKHKKMKLCVLLLGFGITAHAQQASTAAGGDASGSGGTVAYSVGQVVYSTNTDATGTVSEGVQQAYEIFTVGIKETELNISLSVYPNPTANNLTLQASDVELSTLNFQLYDMQGKLLSSGKVAAEQTQINTSSLPPATYLMHVVNQENKKVQSFKIIKN